MKKGFVYGLFLLLIGVIFFFWAQSSGALLYSGRSADLFLSLGRITALLAVFCILMQLVLIGRVAWVEKLFGLDKLSRIHKWNGYAAFIFMIAHPILVTFSYSTTAGQGFFAVLYSLLTTVNDLFAALVSIVIFTCVIGFSITIARKRLKYETWYFVHLATYIAILLAFGHQLDLGGDFISSTVFYYFWYALYVFAFGNLILFRFLRPLYNFYRYRFYVSCIERETHDAVSIYLSGKNLSSFTVACGQFMIVRFLAKGFWWEAHPFSFSTDSRSKELRITVKKVGDFTSKIPDLPIGTQVLIDGPHGIFTTHSCVKNKYLFIAGGVGITPIRSMIGGLVNCGACKNSDDNFAPMILLYGNKTSRDIIFERELKEFESTGLLKTFHIMSDDPNFPGEKGRVDLEKITKLVPDFMEREVFVCGPPIMMMAIVNALKKTQIPTRQIHFENFSL